MPQPVQTETAEAETPCGNKYCDEVVPVGGTVWKARFRDDLYCSLVCRNRHTKRLQMWRRRQDPRANAVDNKRRQLKKYGLTEDDYDLLWDQQMGRCAICHAKFEDSTLHIDHCHESDSVRGLLCHLCNVGIGYFRDNPDLLRSAITYLDQRQGSDPVAVEVGEEVSPD